MTLLRRINSLLAIVSLEWALLMGRLIIAVIFWRSGQTKIEGFQLDPIRGEFLLDWPRLSDSTVFLFQMEYQLPLIAPTVAAVLTAVAEHIFPLLIILGLFTRVSALSLLVMTGVIQIFVYPEAWVTHGLWAAILLMLLAQGAGRLSIDRLLKL